MKKILSVLYVTGFLPVLATTITIGSSEPADKDIVLYANDVLEINGNGLTANCTVTVTNSGYQTTAKIKFLTTATIAAPIYVDDSVEFQVAANATGTVAGKLTVVANSHGDAHVRSSVESGGLLKYTGGASLSGTKSSMYTTFRVLKGNVDITDNPFESTFSISMICGHLTFKDGGAWKTGAANGAGLYLCRSEQNADAIFEVGRGGYVEFGNNQKIHVGYAANKLSKIYVNGGTFVTKQAGDQIYFNYNTSDQPGGSGNAVLEIDNGGIFSNKCHVVVGNSVNGRASIVLGTGLWTAGEYYKTFLITQPATEQTRSCSLSVTGDFTFDLSHFSNGGILDRADATDTIPAVNCAWNVADGAKLTFNGKNYSAASNNKFTFHNFNTDGLVTFGLKETNPISLTFVDAAASLHFGVSFPLATGTRITASGTSPSPALLLDIDYEDSTTTPDVLSTSVLEESFRGFSSVSCNALSVNAADGKIIYVPTELSSALSAIDVKSGTLLLDNGDAFSAGITVNTSDTGTLALVNATGFNSATRMSGTKALTDVASGLIVTDSPRSGEVTVHDGETLYVFGDGLGEEASVKLEGGSTLKFMATTTVAAPVDAGPGNTNFRVAGSAVGTIAGKLTRSGSGSAHLQLMSGNGTLNFIGGAEIGNGEVQLNGAPQTYFDIWSGVTQITNKAFDARCALNIFQGKVRVADGGVWYPGSQQWAHINVGGSSTEQYADACLEIATGGVVRVFNNCLPYVGNNSQVDYTAKLFINGGRFYRDGADRFYLRGNGIVEIDNGGTFSNSRQIEVSSTTAKVLLKNGTLDGNNDFSGRNGYGSLFNGSGNCAVSIEGDFTIDISHYSTSLISNTLDNAATWTVKPGARLHVRGDPTGIDTKKLVFRDFAGDGLALDLNATRNTDVVFADCTTPVKVSVVLPGIVSSRLQAYGSTSDLELGYIVPEGMSYRLGTTSFSTVVTTGFSNITYKNLGFDVGSTMEIPYSTASGAMTVAGTLTLPSAPNGMNYKLVRTGSIDLLDHTPVVTADSVAGNPVWTCVGGLISRKALMEVNDVNNSLDLSYRWPGFVMSFF